jgi:hypothetical protein
MKARISQLYMTEADQRKWASEILAKGEIVVCAPTTEYPYARIKIGDGSRPLSELDFCVDEAINKRLEQVRFEDNIDGGRITEYGI